MDARVHYLIKFTFLVFPGVVAQVASFTDMTERFMYGVHDDYLLDTIRCDYGDYIIA
jgi:hypothetical protein